MSTDECIMCNCDKPVKHVGLCDNHYQNRKYRRRHGTKIGQWKPKQPKIRICPVIDCNNTLEFNQHYCEKHQRQKAVLHQKQYEELSIELDHKYYYGDKSETDLYER